MNGFAIISNDERKATIFAKGEFLPNVELDCSLQVGRNEDKLNFHTPEVISILRDATLKIREAVEAGRIKPREPIGKIK